MYTVTGKTRVIRSLDGTTREVTPPTMTFRDAVTMFRWAIDSGELGARRMPYGNRIADVHLSGRPGDSEAVRVYWTFESGSGNYRWTAVHWDAMYAAQRRIRELYHYVTEVLPEWREESTVHYADNSTVRYEVNRYGGRRSVTVVGPSGDVCF
ncbi:hypothetical protein [Streptomyces olivaceoviridis]|uniref:hypothetical protein n=1 Tax=Streptomyces olivaceoviridis TaxID=1921 RepID=UPI0033314DCB